MAFTRTELLEAVERSPEAAGAHDRAGWVGLFTADGVVEDPVGSRPHCGRHELERFYDTFIGPRDIAFHRDVDVVVGTTVIRNLELEVAMSSAVTMRIPAYLRYDLAAENGEVKITRLQAFWQLPSMVGQFLRNGLRSLPAGGSLTLALLRNQGPAGAAGFVSGFRGVGASGRRQFAGFLADARAGDEVAVRRRLARTASIRLGDAEPLAASDLLARLAGARTHKLIAAGNSVVAAVEQDDNHAVLIADVDPKPFAVKSLRYFTESTADRR